MVDYGNEHQVCLLRSQSATPTAAHTLPGEEQGKKEKKSKQTNTKPKATQSIITTLCLNHILDFFLKFLVTRGYIKVIRDANTLGMCRHII